MKQIIKTIIILVNYMGIFCTHASLMQGTIEIIHEAQNQESPFIKVSLKISSDVPNVDDFIGVYIHTALPRDAIKAISCNSEEDDHFIPELIALQIRSIVNNHPIASQLVPFIFQNQNEANDFKCALISLGFQKQLNVEAILAKEKEQA